MQQLNNMEKIKTEDCIVAIVKYYANIVGGDFYHLGALQNGSNWKRRAKYGSKTGTITREFENIQTGDKVYVYSTEDTILEIKPMEISKPSENEPYPEIAADFKFKVVCDFGVIYTNSKYDKVDDGDIFTEQEMKDDGYHKYTLKKGTRIGWFEPGEANLDGVLVATSDMNFYNYDDSMTCDGIITFEVSKNKGFVPAQEPSDCIENDDWEDLDHVTKLKGFVKKYKLNHLLLSM